MKDAWRAFLREVRDAVFLVDREGRVLYWNERLVAGLEPSDAERFDDRVPPALRLPDPLPATEARTDRLVYEVARGRRTTVRRRLVPYDDGVLCILASEDSAEPATRLEILGRLVGYVSHDLNNMLTAVSGHTDLLLEALEEGSSERAWVDQIREAGRYAARLTHRLLAFGDVAPPRLRELELNEQVGEFAKALVRLLAGSARIDFVPSAQPAVAWFDPARLDQALLVLAFGLHDNLLPGGTIRVRVEARPAVVIEAAPLRNESLDPSFDALGCVRALFADTGALLRERGAGWYVLELPRLGKPTIPRGEGTVLVVDRPDEARVACVRTLEEAGYRVLVAGSEEQALAIAQESGDVDVLLAAFGKAGINGPMLVQRFAKAFPDVRPILISGLANGVKNDSTTSLLPAAYDPDDLLAAVARALR